MTKKSFSIKNSIQSKIFISFVLVLLLPTITISISTYFISINIVKEKVSDSFSQTVLYVRDTVERELEQVKLISDYIFTNPEIKEVFSSANKNQYEQIKDKEKAEQTINNYSISTIFKYINIIKLYGFNGSQFTYGFGDWVQNYDDNQIKNSEGYQKAVDMNGQIVWSGISQPFLRQRENLKREMDISLFRVIKNNDYTENLGVLYLSLRPQVFSQLLDKLEYDRESNIYILDNYDKVINISNQSQVSFIENWISKNQNKPLKNLITNENGNIIINYNIEKYNWNVIGVISIKELTKDNKFIFFATIIAFLVSFLIASVLWYLITSSIVGPIKRLTKTMISIQTGKTFIRVENSNVDEIGHLTNSFNFMIDKINQLFQEGLQKQMDLKDAEYKALQAQINPHFLYNTLNSIRWMAIIHKAENIKRMVDALGRLLKNSTSKMGQFITIEEEINNLKDYIYIQQLAYKNKFDIIWNVDENLLSCKCIKFIMQPIVENAIFHGIEPKDCYGTIEISINKIFERLVISVKDDGVGMSEEQINSALTNEANGRFSGIGVGNVNERIKITYGYQYGISIESVVGSFTVIDINLPLSSPELMRERGDDSHV